MIIHLIHINGEVQTYFCKLLHRFAYKIFNRLFIAILSPKISFLSPKIAILSPKVSFLSPSQKSKH